MNFFLNDFPPFYFGPSVVLHCQIKLLCCCVGFKTVIWLILQDMVCYVWFTYVERFPIYLETKHFCHVPHYCMLNISNQVSGFPHCLTKFISFFFLEILYSTPPPLKEKNCNCKLILWNAWNNYLLSNRH